MSNSKTILLTVCSLLVAYGLIAQKHDYNFLYKSVGFNPNPRSGASITYNEDIQDIEIGMFDWAGGVGASPVLSDRDGIFLGFTNAIHVYDSLGRVAINGEYNNVVGASSAFFITIAPYHAGRLVGHSSQFIPINDSLYYLFFLSQETYQALPEYEITTPQEKGWVLAGYSNGLYLSKVRLNAQGRLYINEDEKAVKLIDDLLGLQELIFCKKADNDGWWALMPRAEKPEAYRLSMNGVGVIESIDTVYFSDQNGRLFSDKQMAFNHRGDKLVRITGQSTACFWDKLEVFDFDRCTGEVNRIFLDSLSQPNLFSFDRDVQFSANDQFLYFAQGSVLYQFDMTDPQFFEHREIVAEWDGFLYLGGLQPLFGQMWELPNGKILVGSFVATPYLHYIHEPNKKGTACNFEQRAIKFPLDPLGTCDSCRVEISGLPSYPQYRMKPLPEPCNTSITSGALSDGLKISPNPSSDHIAIDLSEFDRDILSVEIIDVHGSRVHATYEANKWSENLVIDVSTLTDGLYYILLHFEDQSSMKSGFVVLKP